nr:MAG TPA: hypothetical protein [Caudoviricetes sp.]
MLYNKIEELMRKTGVSAYQISRDTTVFIFSEVHYAIQQN